MSPKIPHEPRAKSFTTLTISDPRYPSLLRNIPDPPTPLHVDGALDPLESQLIAVVGSRRATPYGLRIARHLVGELTQLGFTIVSGLARGIDGAAHEAALKAGGRTIAVLGCGLDVVYPPEHARLRAAIAESGAVLTEFDLGTPPLATHFPRRNRIISGVALGVVVVEAAEDSGSLITAKFALEQGREVFAVPGPVDVLTSRGTHALLKQGAKLTETVEDIIEELLPQLDASRLSVAREQHTAPRPIENPKVHNLSLEQQTVYAVIGAEPLTIDELTERASLNTAVVTTALLELELKAAVRQVSGQRYQLT
jgi:DNA processing protein